jgi:hypothetical protein
VKTFLEKLSLEELAIRNKTVQELGGAISHTEDGFDLLWRVLGIIAKKEAVGKRALLDRYLQFYSGLLPRIPFLCSSARFILGAMLFVR